MSLTRSSERSRRARLGELGMGVAALLACGVLLGGCAARKPAAKAPPESLESAGAGDLLALLAERRDAIRGLRGTAKLRVAVAARSPTEPETRLSTSQAVLVRAPASFRLESLSPFGVSYVVVSDGRQLAVLAPADGLVYRGDAGAMTIGAATGVAAESFEVASLLLGLPPVPPLEESAAWVSTDAVERVDPERGPAPVIYLHAPSRTAAGQTIVVGFGHADDAALSGAAVPVLFERIGRGGELYLRARFGGFRRVDGAIAATIVSVEAPGSEAELRYKDLSLEPSVESGRFVLATPAGMRDAPLGGTQPRSSGS